MVAIDRRRVRLAFDQHATDYDTYACVQKRVVTRFASLLQERRDTPRRVLDIGSGTGMLLRELRCLYPEAELIGIDLAFGMTMKARSGVDSQTRLLNADAENLPLAAATFDLIVSTSAFQWLDALEGAFKEAFRVLKPGGRFLFSLFGENTLHELKHSYRTASVALGRGDEKRTQSFFSAAEVGMALGGAGFEVLSATSDFETEIYSDVPSLLRSIRRIGAGNSSPVASRGLSERRVMLEMMDIYRHTFGQDGMIPATYEVVYGSGMKI